jgi:hypothetical protein
MHRPRDCGDVGVTHHGERVRAVIRAYVQSSWLRGSRHASQAQGDCHGCPRIRDRPIDAKGAFTSEIDLPLIIKPGPLNTVAEADRPQLVDQPGMRHKYLPLRHDPATGAISTGGRYLFHTYEDATKYRDFLASNATACPMQNSKRACQGCLPRILEAKSSPVNRQPSGSVHSSSIPSGSPGATGAHDLTPITTHAHGYWLGGPAENAAIGISFG